MRLVSTAEEQVIAQAAADLKGALWMVDRLTEDYNRLIEEYNNTVAESNDNLARFDALLEKYHALKVTGAAPATPPTKRPTDRVLEVIADVAGSNAPLRSMLGRYARQQRAKNVKDDEIIGTLMHWPDADEDSQTDDMST